MRKAEVTDNFFEAEACFIAAQRLATNSAIDLELVRKSTNSETKANFELIQRVIPIGIKGKHGLKTYAQLFVEIAAANEVKCDIALNSTFVYAFGYKTDIEKTELLYAALLVQMVLACDNYLNSDKFKKLNLSKITARINFQFAFARRIGQRLTEARQTVIDTRTQTDRDAAGSTGVQVAVLLRDKDISVKNFYQTYSQAQGRWCPKMSKDRISYLSGDRSGKLARLGIYQEISSRLRLANK